MHLPNVRVPPTTNGHKKVDTARKKNTKRKPTCKLPEVFRRGTESADLKPIELLTDQLYANDPCTMPLATPHEQVDNRAPDDCSTLGSRRIEHAQVTDTEAT